MATVEIDNINKVYENGFHAVKDLSIDVEDGEFLVLVGPSGCGKSTALRMVAGLEDISTGELRIGGRRVNDVDPQGRDIAMVFQSYALYPHMSVADNIGYGLKLRKMPKDEMNAADRRRGRDARADPAAGPQAQAAVRRPAPARRHGPGDRPQPAGLPDGRAAVQPGREAAGPDAGGDLGRRPVAEHDHPVRHARPDRGDDDGGPDGGHEGGRAPAAGHARRVLRHAAQHLRGPVRGLAADEPRRWRKVVEAGDGAQAGARRVDRGDPGRGARGPPGAAVVRRQGRGARRPQRGHGGRAR